MINRELFWTNNVQLIVCECCYYVLDEDVATGWECVITYIFYNAATVRVMYVWNE